MGRVGVRYLPKENSRTVKTAKQLCKLRKPRKHRATLLILNNLHQIIDFRQQSQILAAKLRAFELDDGGR